MGFSTDVVNEEKPTNQLPMTTISIWTTTTTTTTNTTAMKTTTTSTTTATTTTTTTTTKLPTVITRAAKALTFLSC